MESFEIVNSPIGGVFHIDVYFKENGCQYSAGISTDGPLSTKDYPALVSAFIRMVYTMDDELAIQRQKDVKPGEYNRYNAFVEKCKALAHRAINGYNLDTAKEMRIAELLLYDASDAVNAFSVGNKTMWLSPAIRTQYKDSLSDAKAAGVESVEFAGVIMPTDNAIAALADINLYALRCKQNTDHHCSEINALESIEAVEAYDYTTGYPELKPSF